MKSSDIVVSNGTLRFEGRRIPCTVGRGGITTRKREGDGATPVGSHRIIGMLYRPDRMAKPADWAMPIRPRDIWSDDVADPDYNLMGVEPSGFSHERLFRADPLYDLILLTDWNWPFAVKGRGSAIFVHRWRRPGYPTAGCVAMAPGHLRWLVPRLAIGIRLIVR